MYLLYPLGAGAQASNSFVPMPGLTVLGCKVRLLVIPTYVFSICLASIQSGFAGLFKIAENPTSYATDKNVNILGLRTF